MARTFTMQLRIRYGECDAQGVVFNANWFAFFDVVLTEAWREAIGPYTEMIESGTDLVVAEASARYLGAARFDELVDFEWRINRLGTTGMSTRIDASVDGRPVAEGHMRHVFIEPATKEKKPMPDDIRRAFEPYVEELEPARR
jgi:acyl-CoA thioester hydrolase